MTEEFISISELVSLYGCDDIAKGEELRFCGVAPLHMATLEHVSFLANEKYLEEAERSKAGAILCSKKTAQILLGKCQGRLLVHENPYAIFAKVSQKFFKPQHSFQGFSDKACIDASASIHPSATIFPFAFIAPGVHIGARSVIYPGCFVGAGTTIGEDCILYPNVVVREGCVVEDRVILNPGAVIGGDGFGFAPTRDENIKIPQIGGVHLAADVEVGSNASVDRGALANTQIGSGTKIDSLVQIGHNVQIGKLCFLAGQSGVSGSTVLGDRVMVGGQVGIAGHLTVGDRAVITAQSGIAKNIPAGETVAGSPARPAREHLSQLAALSRLTKKK